ncbi:elongation factor P [Metallumcola ferriviriculae]|uniref:Elongation factor P n=1 Tax=Metallumcola ferriviriculae TaxID=3039180 RepID=A0AAU0USA1_9FIRM|nr:elongation factor P [Desulfitibacteraceae bacterium MK1]
MISTNDFKTGVTIEIDGELYQVVDFQHVKPGKGAAFVRSKLKNLLTGSTVEKTFRAGEKVSKAHVERKQMQYLYNDGDFYHFMDTSTYEQLQITRDIIGDKSNYMKDNMLLDVAMHGATIIDVELPNFVELEVVETEPGIKGDTATGATKSATLATGATVQVPLFINIGDVLRIDTRTGDYMTRA